MKNPFLKPEMGASLQKVGASANALKVSLIDLLGKMAEELRSDTTEDSEACSCIREGFIDSSKLLSGLETSLDLHISAITSLVSSMRVHDLNKIATVEEVVDVKEKMN